MASRRAVIRKIHSLGCLHRTFYRMSPQPRDVPSMLIKPGHVSVQHSKFAANVKMRPTVL